MSEPVFERLWHEATSHLHHHLHQAAPAATNQGETMNLTEIVTDAQSGVQEAQGWLTKIAEEHLPAIVTGVQQIAATETGKALIELGKTVLPPEADAAAAALIRFAVKAAADLAAAGPPAEQMAEPPAEPASAPG